MQFTSILLGLSVASVTMATAPLDLHIRGMSCDTPMGSGSCMMRSECAGGFSVANHCPGATNIQCCVKQTCSTPNGPGNCQNTGNGCSGGGFVPNYCPGDDSIQCCVQSQGSSNSSSSNGMSGEESGSDDGGQVGEGSSGGSQDGGMAAGSKGEAIVNAAKPKEGLPYVWGGGGISGESSGGFDCSGLTSYAVFHGAGVKLPRTAQTQYLASGGKKIPYKDAQAGDLLFWGSGGNCNTGVKHVAIAMGSMRPGYILNAAHTGTPVREQTLWTSSGGESICPNAVRFW